MELFGQVVAELSLLKVTIAHRGHSNKYLPFVVFHAGCYGTLLLQKGSNRLHVHSGASAHNKLHGLRVRIPNSSKQGSETPCITYPKF